MRRAVPACALAGALLSAAACGTARSPEPSGPAPSVAVPSAAPAPAAPALAQTRALCETLGRAYSEHLGPFAEALSATVTGGTASRDATAQKQARQQLSGLADAIAEATRASPDAQVRADGAKTAEQLRRTSADDGFFRKVRSAEDVNAVIGTTLKTWMAPVDRHCS
jgi:hypothetical protein